MEDGKLNSKERMHQQGVIVVLFLFGASLPFADHWSSMCLILAFIVSMFRIKSSALVTNAFPLLVLVSILVLRGIAITYGVHDIAVNDFIRELPILVTPIMLLGFKSILSTQLILRSTISGLIIGLLGYFVICEFNVINQVVENQEGVFDLLRWKYLSHNFSSPIGTHPSYLGILIVFALMTVLFTKELFNPVFKIAVGILLVGFLSQLLARNALLTLTILTIVFAIRNKKYVWLLAMLGVFSLGILAVFSSKSDYLQRKLITNDFTADGKKDKRVERLKVSLDVWKMNPIIGVGPGFDEFYRLQGYEALADKSAMEHNFNSHNQFIEYLTVLGVLGLVAFIAQIVMLFDMSTNSFANFLVYALIALCIGCLTESVLERSLGVKYFSLLSGLILICWKRDEWNIFNWSRS